jgi:protein-disulfide isomerase/uncharacterized membrane protein YphA (DoxX/SURF4 family)
VTWNPLRPWLGTVVRLFLGAIWIWAGAAKVHSPREFVQVVRAYDTTPEWLSKTIGYGLPVLEICLGVLLIVGIAVRLAAVVSALLYVVFLIGVAQVAARGIKLDCGCFGGSGGQTAGATHYTLDILRDVGLLLLAAYLIVWSATRISVEEFLARNDYVEPPSAKRMRSEQGQRKYNALLESRRQAARERTRYVEGSIALVVVLVSIIGIGVQSGRAKIEGNLIADNATVKNGVPYGQAAAATVDIFEDFQCPHCLELETSVGATLMADVLANKAQVRYHTLSFLDSGSSGNRYSTRAANAAICASDVSVDMFVKYHSILFTAAVQPKEGSNGRTDAELITYARQAGMTDEQVSTFTTCIKQEQHKALVQAITENASKRGVTGTPTVIVNGKTLSSPTLAALTKAIAEADAKGPAPSPSPTTSATASTSASPSG